MMSNCKWVATSKLSGVIEGQGFMACSRWGWYIKQQLPQQHSHHVDSHSLPALLPCQQHGHQCLSLSTTFIHFLCGITFTTIGDMDDVRVLFSLQGIATAHGGGYGPVFHFIFFIFFPLFIMESKAKGEPCQCGSWASSFSSQWKERERACVHKPWWASTIIAMDTSQNLSPPLSLSLFVLLYYYCYC